MYYLGGKCILQERNVLSRKCFIRENKCIIQEGNVLSRREMYYLVGTVLSRMEM